MATSKDRLQEALDERNMRPAELARLTQIGEAQLVNTEKASTKLRKGILRKLQKHLTYPLLG